MYTRLPPPASLCLLFNNRGVSFDPDQGWGQIHFIKYKYKYIFLKESNTNTNKNMYYIFIQIQIQNTNINTLNIKSYDLIIFYIK